MDFLERFFQRAFDSLQLLARLDIAGALEKQVKRNNLVRQRLAGLIMQLTRDALAFSLLRLKHTLRADMSFVLEPVEHRVKDGRDPSQIRVREIRVNPQLIEAGLDGTHG